MIPISTTVLNHKCFHLRTTTTINVIPSTHSHPWPPNFLASLTPRTSSTSKLRSSWTISEMAEATDGEILRWGPPGSISTDTRTLQQGQWFFAIAGESFDGHDFVTLELGHVLGCAGVVGNMVCCGWTGGLVRVEGDTLVALKKMAKYARRRFSGVVVALTGSVGKTTTRVMTSLALESLGRVCQTEGNRNNDVGVALTLIGLPRDAKAWVLELGMSGKGEILELERMCRPDVRVILNVGCCHMENFGCLEEVAGAKGELLVEAKQGDICVMNADEPLVMNIPVPHSVQKVNYKYYDHYLFALMRNKRSKEKILLTLCLLEDFGLDQVFFGHGEECDIQLIVAENTDGGSAVRVILRSRICLDGIQRTDSGGNTEEIVEFKLHGPGLHLAMDACAAAAVAVSLGASLSQVGHSISKFRPVSMRSELQFAEIGFGIINDAYNASLTSMIAALNMLKSMDCQGKRVAVLGDMLELGSAAAHAHASILNLCCEACFGLVAVVGENFIAAAEELNLLGTSYFLSASDSESLVINIVGMIGTDDVVLVKGSRAMQLEKVVEVLKSISH